MVTLGTKSSPTEISASANATYTPTSLETNLVIGKLVPSTTWEVIEFFLLPGLLVVDRSQIELRSSYFSSRR